MKSKRLSNLAGFMSLANNLDEVVLIYDFPSHQIVYINREVFLGYRLDKFTQAEDWISACVYSQDLQKFQNFIAAITSGQNETIEIRFKNQNGNLEWLAIKGFLFEQDGSNHIQIILIISVLTKQKRNELLEVDRAHALEMIARDWPMDAIFNHLVKAIGNQVDGCLPAILVLENKCLNLAAASPNLSEEFVFSINLLFQNGAFSPFQLALNEKKPINFEKIEYDESWGEYQPVLIKEGITSVLLMPVYSGEGLCVGLIALFFKGDLTCTEDIVELNEMFLNIVALVIDRRRSTDMLFRQAMYDSLTGLPNRNMLENNLHQIVFQARLKNSNIALVFISLDNFDTIKDTLGYYIGEELLKLVGERLSNFTGDNNRLAHTKENGFAVILENLPERSEALDHIRKVASLLKPPFRVGNNNLYLDISIGYSEFPRDGEDVTGMIKKAEMALAFPRSDGMEKIIGYEPQMNTIALERLRITTQLRQATEDESFILFYQPQIDLVNHKIIGFESLIRWKHEDYGFVPPMTFIPLAEDTGLIVPIGDWVINEACRQFAEWRSQGRPEVRLAINVSPAQFVHSDFVTHLERFIRDYAIPPEKFAIEITESMFMRDLEEAAEKLRRIRKMGMEIHIDDFGTAYSSLSYLRKLPVDCLKIDKSFIDPLFAQEEGQIDPTALPRAIITLGHGLNLSVLAEGVETLQQVNLLTDMGCDHAQGFHYSEPQPAEVIWDVVEKIKDSWKNGHSPN